MFELILLKLKKLQISTEQDMSKRMVTYVKVQGPRNLTNRNVTIGIHFQRSMSTVVSFCTGPKKVRTIPLSKITQTQDTKTIFHI